MNCNHLRYSRSLMELRVKEDFVCLIVDMPQERQILDCGRHLYRTRHEKHQV